MERWSSSGLVCVILAKSIMWSIGGSGILLSQRILELKKRLGMGSIHIVNTKSTLLS